jgi:1-deoxy-D-xylulose-5-phosphate reductoisomerase
VKKIAILGSTGSIGRQCLSVVEFLPGRFAVVALAAGANLEELAAQVLKHRPALVSVADAQRAGELAARLRAAGHAPLPEIQWGR